MAPRSPRLSVLLACLAVAACSPKASTDSAGDDAAGGDDEGGTSGNGATSTFTTTPADGGDDTPMDDGDDGPMGDDDDDDGPTDGGDDGPGSFVMMPDGGGANECDPKAQDCDEGEKCTAWANDGGTFWNANRCVEVSGTGVAGDSCMVEGNGVSGLDDCDVGFICLNTNEENIGTCTGFCTGVDEDCGSGEVCAIYNDGVLPICLQGCDPLLQDCGTGQSCIDTPNQAFICFTDASGEAGAEGDPCPPEHGENSCDPGMWCGAGSFGCDDVNCCTPFCDTTGDACVSPNECVSFFGTPDAAPPGFETVGVCVLP